MPETEKKIRVQIVDTDHPHFPEHGYLTGKVISLFGKSMAEVKLDNCQHGTDACFISQGQIAAELVRSQPRRRRTGGPR